MKVMEQNQDEVDDDLLGLGLRRRKCIQSRIMPSIFGCQDTFSSIDIRFPKQTKPYSKSDTGKFTADARLRTLKILLVIGGSFLLGDSIHKITIGYNLQDVRLQLLMSFILLSFNSYLRANAQKFTDTQVCYMVSFAYVLYVLVYAAMTIQFSMMFEELETKREVCLTRKRLNHPVKTGLAIHPTSCDLRYRIDLHGLDLVRDFHDLMIYAGSIVLVALMPLPPIVVFIGQVAATSVRCCHLWDTFTSTHLVEGVGTQVQLGFLVLIPRLLLSFGCVMLAMHQWRFLEIISQDVRTDKEVVEEVVGLSGRFGAPGFRYDKMDSHDLESASEHCPLILDGSIHVPSKITEDSKQVSVNRSPRFESSDKHSDTMEVSSAIQSNTEVGASTLPFKPSTEVLPEAQKDFEKTSGSVSPRSAESSSAHVATAEPPAARQSNIEVDVSTPHDNAALHVDVSTPHDNAALHVPAVLPQIPTESTEACGSPSPGSEGSDIDAPVAMRELPEATEGSNIDAPVAMTDLPAASQLSEAIGELPEASQLNGEMGALSHPFNDTMNPSSGIPKDSANASGRLGPPSEGSEILSPTPELLPETSFHIKVGTSTTIAPNKFRRSNLFLSDTSDFTDSARVTCGDPTCECSANAFEAFDTSSSGLFGTSQVGRVLEVRNTFIHIDDDAEFRPQHEACAWTDERADIQYSSYPDLVSSRDTNGSSRPASQSKSSSTSSRGDTTPVIESCSSSIHSHETSDGADEASEVVIKSDALGGSASAVFLSDYAPVRRHQGTDEVMNVGSKSSSTGAQVPYPLPAPPLLPSSFVGALPVHDCSSSNASSHDFNGMSSDESSDGVDEGSEIVIAPQTVKRGVLGSDQSTVFLSEYAQVPRHPVTHELMSVGSINHYMGKPCDSPCEWLQRGRSCKNGWRCTFCHIVDHHQPYVRHRTRMKKVG